MAVDGFPNLFFIYGPNSGLNSGSILMIIEKQVDYAVQAVAKLQRERLKSIEVKAEATKDWLEYMAVSQLITYAINTLVIDNAGILPQGTGDRQLT